jgi:hypothetical protein
MLVTNIRGEIATALEMDWKVYLKPDLNPNLRASPNKKTDMTVQARNHMKLFMSPVHGGRWKRHYGRKYPRGLRTFFSAPNLPVYGRNR